MVPGIDQVNSLGSGGLSLLVDEDALAIESVGGTLRRDPDGRCVYLGWDADPDGVSGARTLKAN
jgi:hypothetical protein